MVLKKGLGIFLFTLNINFTGVDIVDVSVPKYFAVQDILVAIQRHAVCNFLPSPE